MLQPPRLCLLVLFFAQGAFGQWLNYPTPGTPRTRDGKADLSAKAPRASDGKPDLSGVWRTEPDPSGNAVLGTAFDVPGDYPSTFSRYFNNILADFKNPEEIVRPEAAELVRKYRSTFKGTGFQCLPLSIPGVDLFSYAPFKIIQGPGEIVILYELDNTHRQIYLDGRKLPEDPQPTWLGYSVGRWEGDTLVVETAGFNDNPNGTDGGYPRTEALHIEERFHRRDFGHLDLQLTVDDPKIFLKPITIKVTELLEPDSDVLEMICNEYNIDVPHLAGPAPR
jgi:hypothetical protein